MLDWLATEYLRTGWDTKRMIRLLVTSGTYRQSSSVTQKQLEADPYNRLLGRASRFRLPAHVIRDQALAVSGLMVETIGGVSVKPYQPPGLWADFSFGKIKYSADSGAKLYRRSLYTFWRRSLGPPNMFDEGTRDVCHVNPQRTNTPLHALTLLNDETFAEAARVFGERLLGTPGNDASRMRRAFTLVLSRPRRTRSGHCCFPHWIVPAGTTGLTPTRSRLTRLLDVTLRPSDSTRSKLLPGVQWRRCC